MPIYIFYQSKKKKISKHEFYNVKRVASGKKKIFNLNFLDISFIIYINILYINMYITLIIYKYIIIQLKAKATKRLILAEINV